MIVLVPVAIVVQSLFLVRTTPIEYRGPPEINFSVVEASSKSELDGGDVVETSSSDSASVSPLEPIDEDAAMVVDTEFTFDDLVRDRDFGRLTMLLTHQDQEVRLAAAQAFADSFVGYFEDHETYEFHDRFRREYWEAVNFETEETKLAVKETFYEALIQQVEAGERANQLNVVMNLWVNLDPPPGETKIPDQEAYEVLAWIADVHPDPMQRYYAAHWFRNAPDEFIELRRNGLNARRRDPSLEVRFYTFMDDLEDRFEPIVYRVKSSFNNPVEAELQGEE